MRQFTAHRTTQGKASVENGGRSVTFAGTSRSPFATPSSHHSHARRGSCQSNQRTPASPNFVTDVFPPPKNHRGAFNTVRTQDFAFLRGALDIRSFSSFRNSRSSSRLPKRRAGETESVLETGTGSAPMDFEARLSIAAPSVSWTLRSVPGANQSGSNPMMGCCGHRRQILVLHPLRFSIGLFQYSSSCWFVRHVFLM